MAFFDFDDAMMDWNGDGRIDRWDAGIETAIIMDQMDQQEKKEQLRRLQNQKGTVTTHSTRNNNRRK